MYEDLIKVIHQMVNDNDLVKVKINYSTSVSTSNGSSSSNPRVILKDVDTDITSILVGTNADDLKVIINPAQIVSATPYKSHNSGKAKAISY